MADGFVKAALLSEVPRGKMKCAWVRDRRILLANIDGNIFAADDMCTHEDASLCSGSLHGEWVKCPLHGSKFNLRTGAVADEPAEIPLKVYPVRLQGEDILVQLE